MSSIIKVNTYQDANGNALFSSDGSGNVTMSANGVKNTPMFHTYLNGHQTVSHNVHTKFQSNVVVKDTDSAYDNTTNYRWTCPSGKGGTYLFWWNLFVHYNGNTITNALAYLKKNGSTITGTDNGNGVDVNDGSLLMVPVSGTFVVDISDGDYIELYGYGTTDNGGSFYFIDKSYGWGGMRLIGA